MSWPLRCACAALLATSARAEAVDQDNLLKLGPVVEADVKVESYDDRVARVRLANGEIVKIERVYLPERARGGDKIHVIVPISKWPKQI